MSVGDGWWEKGLACTGSGFPAAHPWLPWHSGFQTGRISCTTASPSPPTHLGLQILDILIHIHIGVVGRGADVLLRPHKGGAGGGPGGLWKGGGSRRRVSMGPSCRDAEITSGIMLKACALSHAPMRWGRGACQPENRAGWRFPANPRKPCSGVPKSLPEPS